MARRSQQHLSTQRGKTALLKRKYATDKKSLPLLQAGTNYESVKLKIKLFFYCLNPSIFWLYAPTSSFHTREATSLKDNLTNLFHYNVIIFLAFLSFHSAVETTQFKVFILPYNFNIYRETMVFERSENWMYFLHYFKY